MLLKLIEYFVVDAQLIKSSKSSNIRGVLIFANFAGGGEGQDKFANSRISQKLLLL